MEIKIFRKNEWDIRTVETDGEPWFVAKDVAEALGYSNTREAIRTHCKKANDFREADNPTPKKIIPESDLYRLIMRSQLESAERFQDWVTEEVLPSIRKNGGYIHVTPTDTAETIMTRAVLIADQKIKQLELMVSKAAPAVEFRNYATKKGTQWTITDAKNELEISLAELQEKLSVFGFFRIKKMHRNNRLWPKDKFIDCGYCVEVIDGPNYAFTSKGMSFLRSLVYGSNIEAAAMFNGDRQPDLFEVK